MSNQIYFLCVFSDESYTVTTYESDSDCTDVLSEEVAPSTYEVPLTTCAYIPALNGYVTTTCNFAPGHKHHVHVPRDAIYSLLLLLLLAPLIVYGLLFVWQQLGWGGSSNGDGSDTGSGRQGAYEMEKVNTVTVTKPDGLEESDI